MHRDKGELNELRNKAVQMLFKQLTSADKAVVDLAQAGLTAVIKNQRMPKALLQTSLRPILVQLAFYNKLQLPLLKGLACLLQLLSSWFNITLGTAQSLSSRRKRKKGKTRKKLKFHNSLHGLRASCGSLPCLGEEALSQNQQCPAAVDDQVCMG